MRAPRRVALISLTPLIDMIFLLLLFFLLGSDFVPFAQIELDAPRGSGGDSSLTQPILIGLDVKAAKSDTGKTDYVRWQNTPLAFADISTKARNVINDDAEARFIIMPAGAVSLQRLVAVMDALSAGGAHKVGVERDVFDIDAAHF